eukprot:TRINITY_DN21_c6_g1_i1.p1 TRINITY_DN21_c6_g1~~TRINITY_DN21_c6_g1_i1.p1  ORF type:complete len:328 (-),score=64.68 TRINITY_DN21_c6_g1_i1:125-1108(-)
MSEQQKTSFNQAPSSTNGKASDRQLDECNVFVKYLPAELTELEFYALFSPFGEVVSSKIMVDQTTGKSLGYGFVRFKNSAEARNAINAMNGQRISNKRLLCKLANQSASSNYNNTNFFANLPILNAQMPSSNLYIKPLLPETSEDDLRGLFGKYGNILDCKVMIDRHTGLSRQIGFVRFERQDDANIAISEMNGHKMSASAPPLTVKYADTEEQKEARKALRAQHQHQPSTAAGPFWPSSSSYVDPNWVPNSPQMWFTPPVMWSGTYAPYYVPFDHPGPFQNPYFPGGQTFVYQPSPPAWGGDFAIAGYQAPLNQTQHIQLQPQKQN